MDISIIIINHNRSEYLERCLRSCVNQIVFNKRYEIIFVDDGSTDNSWEISNKFKSEIKRYKLKKNKGISYAANFAIKKSIGNYFIRVDSDDFLSKHSLQFMSEILDNNKKYAFVCSDHYRIDEFEYREKLVRLSNSRIIKDHGAGILIRRNIFNSYNGYNIKLEEAEDYELLEKIMCDHPYFYLPIPLYRYYIHKKNISRSGKRKEIIKKIKNKEY